MCFKYFLKLGFCWHYTYLLEASVWFQKVKVEVSKWLHGWGKPNRTLVPWRQRFRRPTRNECMGWFAQIKLHHINKANGKQYSPFPLVGNHHHGFRSQGRRLCWRHAHQRTSHAQPQTSISNMQPGFVSPGHAIGVHSAS